MSDLFHEDLEDRQIDLVFAIMALTPRHTYQILTKRPERMLEYLTVTKPGADGVAARIADATWGLEPSQHRMPAGIVHVPIGPLLSTGEPEFGWRRFLRDWPLPNVWLGVSVEDQERADERIPPLLQTSAAVRFLSCEPLLGPIEFSDVTKRSDAVRQLGKRSLDGIHWVIVGGESGPGARRMEVEWARSIVEQCGMAGVPVFMKQMGGHGKLHPKGGDPSEWPEDLRVREFPEVAGHG